MYLFTRAGQFRPGPVREAMAFVGAITEKVRHDGGVEVHAWQASLSPELGTVVWGLFVESLEELEALDDKLAVSDSYLELVESAAALWAGPLQDSLADGGPRTVDPSAPLPGYVSVARARAANGHVREAMANGVEIATLASEISGVPTMFLADSTGPYGGCRWITGMPDIGTLERSEASLMADDRWLALIDRVGPSYENDATQSIYRRIV